MTLGGCAVVTGASSGIGAATAISLARSGVSVVAAARTATSLADREAAVGTELELDLIDADMTDPAEVDRVFDAAEELRGPVRWVVHSVGYEYEVSWFSEVQPASILRAVASLVTSPALVLHRAIRSMELSGGGVVGLVSSGAAGKTTPGRALYSPAKAALNQLVATTAAECSARSREVGVLAISPGRVDTPAQRRLVEAARTAPAAFQLESFKDTVAVVDAATVGNAITQLIRRPAGEVNGGLFRYGAEGWNRA